MGDRLVHRVWRTMLDEWHISLGLIVGIILALIMHLLTLKTYPPVFMDEPWSASIAWAGVTTGQTFDIIHAGPLDGYDNLWIGQSILGYLPLKALFAVFGPGLLQTRLLPWLCGVFLLLAVAFAGYLLYDRVTGLLAALLLGLSQPFLLSSHSARMDIMVATAIVLSFALATLAFRTKKWWLHALAAFLLAISMDIHQNAALFMPGLAVVYLLEYRATVLRCRGAWSAAAGGLVGIICTAALRIWPDPETYEALSSYLYAYLHYKPIENFRLSDLVMSLRLEISRFRFYENNLDFALLGSSLVYLLYRRSRSDIRLMAFTFCAFLCFVLFQGQKFQYYAIVMYPFATMMLAQALVSLVREDWKAHCARAFAVALVVLCVFNSAIHTIRPILANRNYRYEALTAEMRRVIPPDARVLGMPTWWLGMHDLDYRSDGILQQYHFYKGYNLSQGLEAVRPDILIVDGMMEWNLFDGRNPHSMRREPTFPREDFEGFLAERGTQLLEVNDAAHGPIRVYAIDWSS